MDAEASDMVMGISKTLVCVPENFNSALRVNKLLGIEAVYEFLNRSLLLDLVESNNSRLVCLIELIKLLSLLSNDLQMEGITLQVFSFILGLLVLDLLLH